MESAKAKDVAPKQTPESIASELETIRASLRKRKSDTTTLKILFYTGFAALLFGFFTPTRPCKELNSETLNRTSLFCKAR